MSERDEILRDVAAYKIMLGMISYIQNKIPEKRKRDFVELSKKEDLR